MHISYLGFIDASSGPKMAEPGCVDERYELRSFSRNLSCAFWIDSVAAEEDKTWEVRPPLSRENGKLA